MNSESVDLIATDPPFNKGRDFHATPDSLAAGARFQDRWSWERDVHESWVDEIADDRPHLMKAIESARHAHSDGMGAYMCFMAVRLLAMHRVLKPTGSIYLHCDPTASHYLKAVMDAIFGWRIFRDEIVWRRNESGAKGSQHSAKRWGNNVDHLLYYAKSDATPLEPRVVQELSKFDLKRMFPKIDDKGQRYNTKMTAWRSPSMGPRPNLCYEFHGHVPPYPSGWRLGRKRMQEEYDKGNVVVLPDKLERRSYAKDYAGVSPGNLWADKHLLLGAQDKERTGYPTQKPVSLYERIVKASSNKGDMVFDPFCGCATTLVAAEKLQRRWVGIDIWEGAHKLVRQRLEDTTGFFGKVSFTDQVPDRTDDGETSAPYLRVRQRVKEPDGPRWTRKETYDHLLDQNGSRCMGCDRTFDDPRYLELDHNIPRSDGGINHVTNRILLCGPCNKLKSNIYTLSGLRRENKKRGYMVKT